MTAPENGSSARTSYARAARPCAPLRKSTGRVASRIRAPAGMVIMRRTPRRGQHAAPRSTTHGQCQGRRAPPHRQALTSITGPPTWTRGPAADDRASVMIGTNAALALSDRSRAACPPPLTCRFAAGRSATAGQLQTHPPGVSVSATIRAFSEQTNVDDGQDPSVPNPAKVTLRVRP